MLSQRPKRHRYPACVISHCVWLYHRFSSSYRDIEELMMARGVRVSYEGPRQWCLKFSRALIQGLGKKEPKRGDKWHLDEMAVRVNGEPYVVWRAVDSEGYELDILLQKRRNKKSATRFLKRLLGNYPVPRVIVTDKLRSYCQPIKTLAPSVEHRRHKGLNNRAENSHQSIRRREKSLIKMKKVSTAQKLLKLMGLTRNLFAVNAGRYAKPASLTKYHLKQAFTRWNEVASQVIYA